MPTGTDPVGALRRACGRALPSSPARSATLFVAAYVGSVVLFIALMSTIVEIVAGSR